MTWYAGGLRFECTQCGNCCTGGGGYVWIPAEDEASIAGHLGLTPDAFRERYIRLVDGRQALIDKPNGDCIFLSEERACSINPVKPRQCLTYPFWPRITASEQNWRATAATCPGIGTGPLYDAEAIEFVQDRANPRDLVWRILKSKRE